MSYPGGTRNNAWSGANVGANGDSAIIDIGELADVICAFGRHNATTTLEVWVSQDGTNFTKTSGTIATTAATDFYAEISASCRGAKFVRLRSLGAGNPVNVTVAGKGS